MEGALEPVLLGLFFKSTLVCGAKRRHGDTTKFGQTLEWRYFFSKICEFNFKDSLHAHTLDSLLLIIARQYAAKPPQLATLLQLVRC